MAEPRRSHRDVRAWNEVALARAAELGATAEWLAQRQLAAPQPGAAELLSDISGTGGARTGVRAGPGAAGRRCGVPR